MFAYPFSYLYFKTNQTRKDLAKNLTSVTFLSDADFKKEGEEPSVFFGEVSEIDFSLENISKSQITTNFVRGHFLGADNETFVRIRCGAWKHQRVYFLLIALLFATTGFLIYYALQAPHGFEYPEQFYQIYGYNHSEFIYNLGTTLALIMEGIIMVVMGIIFTKYRNFKNSLKGTTHYFLGLWEAESINKLEIPLVFR